MSTRPSRASCTIVARRSGCIAERDAELAQLSPKRDEPRRLLVEDRGEERRIRDRERVGDVARGSGTAGGDDRERNPAGRWERRSGAEAVFGASRAVGGPGNSPATRPP